MIATTTNKQVKRSMIVRFDMESCEIHEIEHLNDCTDEEVADKWLTKKEWKEIRDGYKQIVEHLPKNVETSAASLLRGLERFFPEMAKEKSQRISNSIHSVLVEQNRQCTDGVQDDNGLADVYRKNTSTSTEKAYRMALDDEHVANRIYKESKMRATKYNAFFFNKSRKVQRGPSMLTQIRQAAKSMTPPRR